MARVPRTIGPYRIVELLGRGGMGVVYRAQHRKGGPVVALKTVRVPRRGELAAIRREIHALASLRHPGIVPIVEEGVHRGVPWYAMELLEGSTLRNWLTRRATRLQGPTVTDLASSRWWTHSLSDADPREAAATPLQSIGPTETPARPMNALPIAASGVGSTELVEGLNLLRRLCSPLGFLHGEGLVHGDLKPENIWLRSDGQPVLVDFGIVSRFADELSREQLESTGRAAGTLAYMAPEQIRGELRDARADLYSLGCLLYEICTGRGPFIGESAAEVLRLHLTAEPVLPSGLAPSVPNELDVLILRLLHKQPQRRLGYADDVAAALTQVLLGLGGADDPSGTGAEAPTARPYLYRPRFVGRDDLLEELMRQLDRTEEGSGSVTLLSGESGAGKTRLLMELVGEAHNRGLHVLEGGSLPAGEGLAPALGALRRSLLALADLCRERGKAETERIIGQHVKVLAPYQPALATLPGQAAAHENPGASSDRGVPVEAARLRLFRALAETFGALSEPATPGAAAVLLVLDDLQWADELTLGCLKFLSTTTGHGRRVLAVGAYRSDEASDSLRALIDSPRTRRFSLARLEESSIGWMIADMLAMPAAPERFVRFLVRQSEGNALFLGEYLRAAIAEDVLYRDGEGFWQVAEPGQAEATAEHFESLPLPASVRSLVARRLEGLGTRARRFVEAASVLGRQSPEELTGRLARLRGMKRLEAIQELVTREVLQEAGQGHLRFVHDKIREVAYGELADARRGRLHLRAAEALSELTGSEREARLAELGQHWERGGNTLEAARCYLDAARNARDHYAHDEAERLYRAHLALESDRVEPSVKARAELGELLGIRGRVEEALEEYQVALAQARSVGDRASEGRILDGLGGIQLSLARTEEAQALCEEALAIRRALGDREGEVETLRTLAGVRQRQGHIEQAVSICEMALRISHELGDAKAEAGILFRLGVIEADQGHFRRAQELYEQALRLPLRPWIVARALGNLASMHAQQGNLSEATELFERAIKVSRETGEREGEGTILGNFASFLTENGRLGEAITVGEQALKIHQEVGNRRAEGIGRIVRAQLNLMEGRPGEARAQATQGMGILQTIADPRPMGLALHCLATIERRTGSLHEAAKLIGEAEERSKRVNDESTLEMCLRERGYLSLAQGQPAIQFLDQAQALADRLSTGVESALQKDIGALRRAFDAFASGLPLIRGELREDLPEGLRRWSVENGLTS